MNSIFRGAVAGSTYYLGSYSAWDWAYSHHSPDLVTCVTNICLPVLTPPIMILYKYLDTYDHDNTILVELRNELDAIARVDTEYCPDMFR